MPVTIDGLQLVGAQESQSNTEAQADVTSAPSQDSDEALVVSLEAAESTPLSGTATGIRLTSDPDYSSDPEKALAQWVQQLESLASAEQGDGYILSDDERNRDVRVIVTGVDWTLAQGAPWEVQWTLDAERGEGVLDEAIREPTTATPNSSVTLDGTDLGSIREQRTELSVDVDTTPIAYAESSETVITPGSGVVRRIDLSGRVGGTPTELRNFESTVRGYIGSNQNVTFQTGFPGTTHDVVVANFNPVRVGGQPATMRYTLSLIEGLAL